MGGSRPPMVSFFIPKRYAKIARKLELEITTR
jgi:hypothetical protein